MINQNYTFIDAAQYEEELKRIVDVQQAPVYWPNYTYLASSFYQYTVNKVMGGYVPQSIIKRDGQNITINTFIPSAKECVSMYEDFNIRVSRLKSNGYFQVIAPSEPSFWNKSTYFTIEDEDVIGYQTPSFYMNRGTEIADSFGSALKAYPFNQVAVDINRITNQILNEQFDVSGYIDNISVS